ncbi:hypothetical protein B0H13DRAFT_2312040 [Mycena leptocephala]|nr:hypothetical protein B0H13DRAFT_2312040 [Mycena leptocephala]
MSPKRTRQDSAQPESAPKRTRTDYSNADPPLSPMSDLSESELTDSPDIGLADAPVATTVPGGRIAPEAPTSAAVEAISTVTESVIAAPSAGATAPVVAIGPTVSLDVQTLNRLTAMGVNPSAVAGIDPAVLKTLFNLGPAAGATAVHVAEQPTTSTQAVTPEPGDKPVRVAATTATATVIENADDPADQAKALLALAKVGVVASRVQRWSVAELKRLFAILMRVDDERKIYSINRGPNNKDWGVPAAFENNSNTLCAAGTSDPLNLWIAGEVAAQWWVDNDGFPAARPAISVQPMAANLPDYCKTMLNELCMPPNSSTVADQFGPSQVKASRWMNTLAVKGQPAKTFEFKAVYDARKTLRDKKLLEQLNVSQLKIHDFVILEVRVARYFLKEKDSGSDGKGKKRAVDHWQAFFDLQAIYKIKDAIEVEEVRPVFDDFEI